MKLSDISIIAPESTINLISTETSRNFSQKIPYGPKNLGNGEALLKAITSCSTKFCVLLREGAVPEIDGAALEKLAKPLIARQAAMSYSDYRESRNGTLSDYPLIDCQLGGMRDDFDFGPLTMIDTPKANGIISNLSNISELQVGAWYSLRLRLSHSTLPVRIPEYLYSVKAPEKKMGYEEQFSYVDPKNRNSQIEFEKVFTDYSKEGGFFLPERKDLFKPNLANFPVKASVVIPVRDRHKTISEAVRSALSQKTNFSFNVIVVDNHSTDGTTKILADIAATEPRLIHICPEEKDLLIGGCWNKGISAKECGAFAVQLDSDDLYISDNTLQKIIDKFEEDGCAAVVGSYNLVDFNLKDIPPGLIDHKEWTQSNGHNNALRIHGLGAPRAIATEIARQIKFENVSYGEDYAMMLAICRNYKLGRIYDSLYLCRRWDGNSDANLSIEKKNKNNIDKDLIRTREIIARKNMTKGGNN